MVIDAGLRVFRLLDQVRPEIHHLRLLLLLLSVDVLVESGAPFDHHSAVRCLQASLVVVFLKLLLLQLRLFHNPLALDAVWLRYVAVTVVDQVCGTLNFLSNSEHGCFACRPRLHT